MKLFKLFLLFLLFILVSVVIINQNTQEQKNKNEFSNVTSNDIFIHSFEHLENKTPLEGEFKPILTLPAWDFQGFEDRLFVYYNGTLKVYNVKSGKLLLNVTPVYDYYFSNRYAYIKTDNGSFVLDYETLRLAPIDTDKNVEYAFNLGNCRITAREKSILVNSQVFTFNSTPKVAFFPNGFVVYGLYKDRETRVIFFDERCNILNDTIISNYPLVCKVVDHKIFFIRRGLFAVNQSKFPKLKGEQVLHEYLSMSSVYLFNSKGQEIASLGMGGIIGFYNNTLYSFKVNPDYCDELIKFYLSNKSLKKQCFRVSHYSGWFVSQGTFGDFGDGFMAFAYWGFSGESGTAYNYLCVYVYDKRLNCIPYYSGTKRVSPIDEIKAWDRYFAIVPRGSEEVVVYEVE
ncbi:hypothetical protein [Thermococcus barophilus]|uniref:Uncharacterized protein n=1 Tax=Thermococcus barophilus (strain DSM 11836 / MP) TaxID=391623 RepID=F0LH77_THEBM|nr:hypothetical protein [Thermococcus barophilus]ADT83039.1 hypothetical protein TERMP_00061 [Thermococcus barophilus MP]